MDSHFKYFIERTDARMQRIEDTLNELQKIMAHSMHNEKMINALNTRVTTLEHLQSKVIGGILVLSVLSTAALELIKFLFK